MPVNNRKKPASADWRTYPLEKWNTTTFTAYLTELTEEHFGVTYEPGGGGTKSQRWSREKGMLKNAQGTYGNAVLKRFIEMCISEYRPNPDYPYASFTFMYSYMDRNFAKAQSELSKQHEREKKAEQVRQESEKLAEQDFDIL